MNNMRHEPGGYIARISVNAIVITGSCSVSFCGGQLQYTANAVNGARKLHDVIYISDYVMVDACK